MPDPGGAEDVVELGVAGLPAQFADGFLRTGNEDGRVAGAPGMDFDRDGVAGDAAGRLDDFADAESMAVAEVEDERLLSGGATSSARRASRWASARSETWM